MDPMGYEKEHGDNVMIYTFVKQDNMYICG